LWQPLEAEEVRLDQGLGRMTAAPVWARLCSPNCHSSAMDGYAVRASETSSASDTAPVRLILDAQAKYVDTGNPLPDWADAVIPIEDVQIVDGSSDKEEKADTDNFPSSVFPPSSIEIRSSAAPRQHVRLMGEDVVATELILPVFHLLRPVDLGAIAAGGHATISVWRKPKVAVVPTGSELVPRGTPAKPGDILEYNSLVLATQVEQWGGVPTRYDIVPDEKERIEAMVADAAATHDLVLLNAGAAAGSADHSAQVVQSLGIVLVHGIAIRPGHPVILGMVENLKAKPPTPIIGVPGFPVSAALTGELFVEPILAKWLGRIPHVRPTTEAIMTRKVFSPLGSDEYLRVMVGEVGGRVVAAPLPRGAGMITSLMRADGIVCIPRHREGLNAGDPVTVKLYRSPDDLERTIIAIGSHDLTLDLIAQFLAESGVRFSSANVGSQAGLVALSRGEAHLAGSHLLDLETGEYNSNRYIKQYLPETPVVVVTLVGREQGLIVPRGNPLRFRSLGDLARPEVRFVNRQRGAGTRVLLDYELSKIGLRPETIHGYEHEEYTHLAVAAAVASGLVHCGLGIAAAAQPLGLDFVPLFKERYDLIIPQIYFASSRLRPLLDLLHDAVFRRQVAALPGYDVSHMGTVAQK